MQAIYLDRSSAPAPEFSPPSTNVTFRASVRTETSERGRKQACDHCRQRKKRCDATLPACSNCNKLGIKCVLTRPTGSSPSCAGTQRGQADSSDNLQYHNAPLVPYNPAAPWASLQLHTGTSAGPPDPIAWGVNSIPNFLPPSNLLPSLVTEAGNNPRNNVMPRAQSSEVNNGGERGKRTKRGRDMSSDTSSLEQDLHNVYRNTSNSQHSLLGRMSGEIPPNQVDSQDDFELLDFQIPLHEVTRSSMADSNFSDSNAPDPTSPATSVISVEPEPSRHAVDMIRARQPIPTKPLHSLPSDNPTLPQDELHELIEIYFANYHQILPCIHRNTFIERVKRGGSPESDPLLWAVLAVAAPDHLNHNIQALQSRWLNHAKTLFDKDMDARIFPTRSLQAAVWIIFSAYVLANITEAWFFVGKACRLAQLLGFDRTDCERSNGLKSMVPRPRDAIEVEERRKTVWVLFYLDRSISCLAGFPLAIDDRYFKVNYPIDDGSFQASSTGEQLLNFCPEPFTTDMAPLTSPAAIRLLNLKRTQNHIFQASVLLGRIMTLHNQLHVSHERAEYMAEFTKLDSALSLFTLVMSHCSRNGMETTSKQKSIDCWLISILQTCTMLLHHPTVSQPSVETQKGNSEQISGYTRCLTATRFVVEVAKEAAKTAPQSVVNPFLVTVYFLCSRFLTISWHEDRNQFDREDVDFLLTLIDRVGERWPLLAKKYRRGILRDLVKNDDDVKKMRVGTGCYIDIDCV